MALMLCREAFFYLEDGAPRVVRKGDIVEDGDNAYKKHRDKFEPIRATNFPRSRAVETMTAAPGEKRRRTRAKPSEE